MATQAPANPPTRNQEPAIVRITPSKADNWQQCGYRFSWQERNGRRRRQQGDYSVALAMGNASHAMFAEVNHAIVGGATLPEIGETLDQHWNPSHFQTPEDAEDGKRKGATMLANYFAHLRDHHLSVNAFERSRGEPSHED